jgi:hypothetical protein
MAKVLMSEAIAYIAAAQVPAVFVNIMRGGPGLGGILPSLEQVFFWISCSFFPVRMISSQLLCHYQSDIFSVHNASVNKDYGGTDIMYRMKSLAILNYIYIMNGIHS